MKRRLLSSALLLALLGSPTLAQPPGGEFDPEAAPAAPPAHAEAVPAEEGRIRRQLAAPLHNQFDAYRRPRDQEEQLKADVVTPEMWLYQQEMRRYNDPLQAVRLNAAARADQRRARLASQAWFGYSNTRPQASPIPFCDMYSPTWVANSWNPYAWVGSGLPSSNVRIEPIIITR